MGSGFSKMKKQAKMMQEQYRLLQDDLKSKEVEGEAGNGLVKITLSGEKELKKIKIHPDCVNPSDVEGLEDLIRFAYQDAVKKISDQPALPAGMNLPFSL